MHCDCDFVCVNKHVQTVHAASVYVCVCVFVCVCVYAHVRMCVCNSVHIVIAVMCGVVWCSVFVVSVHLY